MAYTKSNRPKLRRNGVGWATRRANWNGVWIGLGTPLQTCHPSTSPTPFHWIDSDINNDTPNCHHHQLFKTTNFPSMGSLSRSDSSKKQRKDIKKYILNKEGWGLGKEKWWCWCSRITKQKRNWDLNRWCVWPNSITRLATVLALTGKEKTGKKEAKWLLSFSH